MNAPIQAPEYLINKQGYEVSVEDIEPSEIVKNDLVNEFFALAMPMQQQMKDLKAKMFGDFYAFVQLSADKYDIQVGGLKGNVTLTAFDGKTRVILQQQDQWDYDERLNIAKELIDEFFVETLLEIETALEAGGVDANAEALTNMRQIKALIDKFFQVGKKGKINLGQIQGLRHYKFKHPKWEKAMEAIADGIHSIGTAQYIRLQKRDEKGKFQTVVLDFAGV